MAVDFDNLGTAPNRPKVTQLDELWNADKAAVLARGAAQYHKWAVAIDGMGGATAVAIQASADGTLKKAVGTNDVSAVVEHRKLSAPVAYSADPGAAGGVLLYATFADGVYTLIANLPGDADVDVVLFDEDGTAVDTVTVTYSETAAADADAQIGLDEAATGPLKLSADEGSAGIVVTNGGRTIAVTDSPNDKLLYLDDGEDPSECLLCTGGTGTDDTEIGGYAETSGVQVYAVTETGVTTLRAIMPDETDRVIAMTGDGGLTDEITVYHDADADDGTAVYIDTENTRLLRLEATYGDEVSRQVATDGGAYVTVSHVASSSGNPLYIETVGDGDLTAETHDGEDAEVGYGATAAPDLVAVYVEDTSTVEATLLAVLPTLPLVWLELKDDEGTVIDRVAVYHDADAATNGVALTVDPAVTLNARMEAIFTNTADHHIETERGRRLAVHHEASPGGDWVRLGEDGEVYSNGAATNLGAERWATIDTLTAAGVKYVNFAHRNLRILHNSAGVVPTGFVECYDSRSRESPGGGA